MNLLPTEWDRKYGKRKIEYDWGIEIGNRDKE